MNKQNILDIKNGIYNLLLSIKNNKHVFDKTIKKSPEVLINNKLEQDADNIQALFNDNTKTADGGKGSGNFGHKGRPGKRGGSSKTGQKPLDEKQMRAVWEEYCKRVKELNENDNNGFAYGWVSEKGWQADGKKIGQVINRIRETGEGLFKDDAAIDECEKQYEEAVKNKDIKLADKLKKILRYNMAIEAMYDVSQELFNNEPADNKQDTESIDNKQNEPILDKEELKTEQTINGYDITNDSEVFNENGEANLQFVSLSLPVWDNVKTTDFIKKMKFDKDKYNRFNNILEINKSEFINFCNSNTKQKQEYKNNSEQYEKELLDKNSDLSYYLNFPSLIDAENKNRIFSIAFNNYDKSNLIQEQKDIEYTYKLPIRQKQYKHVFDKKQSAFIHEALGGIFDTKEDLAQFIGNNGGISEIYVPNYTDEEIDKEIEWALSLYENKDMPTIFDIKNYKSNMISIFAEDRLYWRKGGQSFSNFLIRECLLNKCAGLNRTDARKAMLDFMYGLQDGKSLKEADELEIEYSGNAGYTIYNLNDAEKRVLNGYLKRGVNNFKENRMLLNLKEFGYTMKDLFGNYDNKMHLDVVYDTLAQNGMGLVDDGMPIKYQMLMACIDGLVDRDTIEYQNDIYNLDEKNKINFYKNLTEAFLNNDTKKLEELYQKRYITDLYKELDNGVRSLELQDEEAKRDLPNNMSQILGNISEITDIPIEQINNEYVNDLYDSDRKNKEDLFTLFNKISADTQRQNLEDEVEYLLQVFKSQSPYRILKNLAKNMRFTRFDTVRAFNLYGLVGQVIKNKDFMHSTEKQKKDLLKQYAKKLVDIYEGKDVSILSDNSKYKKMGTYYIKQKEETEKLEGKLIKNNTKELDTFIDALSNIQYNDTANIYSGIEENGLLGKQNTYNPDDFEGLKLNKKAIEQLQRLNSKLKRNDRRMYREINSEVYGYLKAGFNRQEMIESLQSSISGNLQQKQAISDELLLARCYILKGMKNIKEDDIKNKKVWTILENVYNKVGYNQPELKRNNENKKLPSLLKSNRIALRYDRIKNKPDIKSNFLDTTVIKDTNITKDKWNSKESADFINKLMPHFNISQGYFQNLVMGEKVESIMGRQWIGEDGQEEFEEKYNMSTSLASKRQKSSEKGGAEPINEGIKNVNGNYLVHTADSLKRIIFSMTSSGASYTSAIQEDEMGMGSFIRTLVAAAPVMEGEFLRCEAAADLYRNYADIKEGDSIVFNAQHFTYDPVSFGEDAADMFGEIGFRVKGKMPFLNMMPMVKPNKMTEWEGLAAGFFKVKKIHTDVSEYGADFKKFIDLEFDWDNWKNYIHANAKMFANQIGLYDRNGKMKVKDFLNFLLKIRLNY